jgi:hypothetical protein
LSLSSRYVKFLEIFNHGNKWGQNQEEMGGGVIFSNKKLIVPTSRIEGCNTLKNRQFIRLFLNLSKSNFHGIHYLGCVKWVPCYHDMACPQGVNGGEGLQI